MKKHIIHLNIFISKLIVLIFVCSTSLLSFSQDTKHNQTLNDSLSVKAEKNYEFTNQDTKVPLRFQTDAERLTVKFITKDTKKLKSNTNNTKTELYCKTTDGKWVKIDGKYFFGDTTVCVFDRLLKNEGYVNNQEYFLFFSELQSISRVKIAVPKISYFKSLSPSKERPISVYNIGEQQTSPMNPTGLSWVNELSRRLDRPVIYGNWLGKKVNFNSSTLMHIIDFTAIKSNKVSLTPRFKKSILHLLHQLQSQNSKVPILFISSKRIKTLAIKSFCDSLSLEGIKNLYCFDDAVGDLNKPSIMPNYINDSLMEQNINTCEKKIRAILIELLGNSTTTNPVTQRRDATNYDWETRHNEILALNKAMKANIVFIGNSITHYWGGKPVAPYARGKASWGKYFEPNKPINMGFGWDRIENVLWRVHHGELDNISPKQIIVMIGTNNLEHNSDVEIVEGIEYLIKAIQLKQPKAIILLMGILPRRSMEIRIANLNKILAETIKGINIKIADAGMLFLKGDNTIDETMFSDGLHPNAIGYEKLGKFIDKSLLKEKSKKSLE